MKRRHHPLPAVHDWIPSKASTLDKLSRDWTTRVVKEPARALPRLRRSMREDYAEVWKELDEPELVVLSWRLFLNSRIFPQYKYRGDSIKDLERAWIAYFSLTTNLITTFCGIPDIYAKDLHKRSPALARKYVEMVEVHRAHCEWVGEYLRPIVRQLRRKHGVYKLGNASDLQSRRKSAAVSNPRTRSRK